MAVFDSKPDQAGILQHNHIEDRTFPVQGGVLHITDGEFEHLLNGADPNDTVYELGRLGVNPNPDGVVEAHIYKSENPDDTRKVFVSTNPNDPLTVVGGKRVI